MKLSAFLMRFRSVRRMYVLWYTSLAFLVAAAKPANFASRAGWQQMRGKARRILISFVPPLARALKKKYGLSGGCTSCGASCKLLNQCPHWNDQTHLCGVYEDRPQVCRNFPITPQDLRDRDLVLKTEPCGFSFERQRSAVKVRERRPQTLVNVVPQMPKTE